MPKLPERVEHAVQVLREKAEIVGKIDEARQVARDLLKAHYSQPREQQNEDELIEKILAIANQYKQNGNGLHEEPENFGTETSIKEPVNGNEQLEPTENLFEQMDKAAQLAAAELLKLPKEHIISVATWWEDWYRKAGHRRLARELMKIAKKLKKKG